MNQRHMHMHVRLQVEHTPQISRRLHCLASHFSVCTISLARALACSCFQTCSVVPCMIRALYRDCAVFVFVVLLIGSTGSHTMFPARTHDTN
ncbi:hypothetical protein BDR03DRAFT_195988 [Suillus americanus]|nr:hypothetical protein BDR03DRAFT_195988 [Suillus americanus]